MSRRASTRNLSILILAFSLGLPGICVWGQSADSLARRGNALYKQQKFQDSVDSYRQALIRKPR